MASIKSHIESVRDNQIRHFLLSQKPMYDWKYSANGLAESILLLQWNGNNLKDQYRLLELYEQALEKQIKLGHTKTFKNGKTYLKEAVG